METIVCNNQHLIGGNSQVLWIGQLIVTISVSMIFPFWPLLLRDITHSEDVAIFWTVLVYSGPLLITVFSSPIWGKMGDKIGHRKMIFRAAIGLLVTHILVSISKEPILIFGCRLFQGIFAGFGGAVQAYALSIIPSSSHGKVLGKLDSATSVGTLIGPFFGSLIAEYLGYSYISYFSTTICLIAVCYLFLFLENALPLEFSSEDSITENPINLIKVENKTSNRIFFLYLLFIMSVKITKTMMISFFTLFVIEDLKGNNIEAAILYSSSAFTVFLSAPYWGKIIDAKIKKQVSLNFLLLLMFLSAGVVYFLLPFCNNFYWVLLLKLLNGIFVGGVSPILFTLIINCRKPNQRGKTIGLGHSASKLGSLIGMSSGALLERFLGARTTFTVIAIIYFCLFGILFLTCFFNSTKNIIFKKITGI